MSGYGCVEEVYGSGLKNVALVTIAPELEGVMEGKA